MRDVQYKRERERESNKRERKDGEGVQVVLIILFGMGTLGGFQLRSAGRDRTRDFISARA